MEPRFPVPPVDVGHGSKVEGSVANVDGAANLAGVVAAPMQEQMSVEVAVAGTQLYRHAARQGHRGILEQLLVFGRVVHSLVALRHNPQYAVLVKGDVPLKVARTMALRVGDHTQQWRRFARAYVPVPRARTSVMSVGAADGIHVVHGYVFRIDQLPANPQGCFPEQEFNGETGVAIGAENEPRL